MDFSMYMSFIIGMIFVLVPSFILTIMVHGTALELTLFAVIFGAIATGMGLLPSYFMAVWLIALAAIFFYTIAGRGGTQE